MPPLAALRGALFSRPAVAGFEPDAIMGLGPLVGHGSTGNCEDTGHNHGVAS